MTIQLTKPVPEAATAVFSQAALEFVSQLEQKFGARRLALLAARAERAKRLKNGELPHFLPETSDIRESEWTVAPLPQDLQDRRTEITGPVDRKMVINALNSGAKVFMADFEDANSPTWSNTTLGQVNLLDANKREITLEQGEKIYRLNQTVATLKVRPRGWHLEERHAVLDNAAISASLFDFGIYFFHNVQVLLARGSAPYFYLPKLESHLEARLWNDVFVFSQDYLGVPQGTIGEACPPATSNSCPLVASCGRLRIVSRLISAMEASASPRNPSVATRNRSSASAILLVA